MASLRISILTALMGAALFSSPSFAQTATGTGATASTPTRRRPGNTPKP